MALLPRGSIIIWHSTLGSIPAGWLLCNGANGTPNLLGMFVPGAGGGWAPGDTGGAGSHNHTFTTDGHTHSIPVGAAIQSGANFGAITSSSVDTGTTDSKTNRPPFHALAYIMKQ